MSSSLKSKFKTIFRSGRKLGGGGNESTESKPSVEIQDTDVPGTSNENCDEEEDVTSAEAKNIIPGIAIKKERLEQIPENDNEDIGIFQLDNDIILNPEEGEVAFPLQHFLRSHHLNSEDEVTHYRCQYTQTEGGSISNAKTVVPDEIESLGSKSNQTISKELDNQSQVVDGEKQPIDAVPVDDHQSPSDSFPLSPQATPTTASLDPIKMHIQYSENFEDILNKEHQLHNDETNGPELFDPIGNHNTIPEVENAFTLQSFLGVTDNPLTQDTFASNIEMQIEKQIQVKETDGVNVVQKTFTQIETRTMPHPPESEPLNPHDLEDVSMEDVPLALSNEEEEDDDSDINGFVDIYKLRSQVAKATGQLNKEYKKYRHRTKSVTRQLAYLEQLKRECAELTRLTSLSESQAQALQNEAQQVKVAMAAISEDTVDRIAAETQAHRLEPTCYRRYVNVRTTADVTNILTAIRGRQKALHDLEILVFRKQLVLQHVLPAPAPEKPSAKIPRISPKKNKKQEAVKELETAGDSTSEGSHPIILEVVSPSVPQIEATGMSGWFSGGSSQSESPLTSTTQHSDGASTPIFDIDFEMKYPL